ncbi:MAG: hypothetical protein M4579_007126 [Chaenotheca gracillima]|nr:MAG: hypothetical protein M4579_007126 [Chaenotheca gracillima]
MASISSYGTRFCLWESSLFLGGQVEHSFNAMRLAPPFAKCHELYGELNGANLAAPGEEIRRAPFPSHPRVKLDDRAELKSFLERELCAPDLETMAPRLWVMTTQSSSNINPLHRQKVKGREIVVTEDPRLHCIWIHNRIFIKPIPRYLLCYDFWDSCILGPVSDRGDRLGTIEKAATGYLRTFQHLIQHESDFAIAQQDHLRLVPQDVTWPMFCDFVSDLESIRDVDVSGRYQYGEIRLSRLNFYAPFFLGRYYFEQIHGQYSDIFGRLMGPVLFIFAIVSTVLNSMQVEMAVEQVSAEPWQALQSICRWFSILSLLGTVAITLSFAMLWTWIFADEWIFALKSLKRRRREGSTC